MIPLNWLWLSFFVLLAGLEYAVYRWGDDWVEAMIGATLALLSIAMAEG